MRNAKGWLVWVMVVAIGLFVLGAAPPAHANFVLSLQEDAGPVTPVASGPSLGPLIFSGIFGDYSITFFSGTANNGAGGSNLLSSTNRIESLVAGTHTLGLLVSNQDYTLPAGSPLRAMSGMGGTYGAETGFTGGAVFQMWADSGNGLNTIPGTFTNGIQTANPASGNGTSFDTGTDPSGSFTRSGPFSLTSRTRITTTGLGDVNYSNHALITRVPEPGLLLIGLMGVGGMGLYIGMRRKR